MIAQCVGMIPYKFIHSSGDTHVYLNHWDAFKKQLKRKPHPLPVLYLNPDIENLFDFKLEDLHIEGYKHHPSIKYDVSI